MTSRRPPWATVLVAWIVLKLAGLLLGFGFTIATVSKRSGASRIAPEVGLVIGYASLALLLVLILLLLSEGKLLIALAVAVFFFGLPFALQGARNAGIGQLPTRRTDPQATRLAAVMPVADLYGALSEAPRKKLPRAVETPSAIACARMTDGAQRTLERAMIGHGSGGRGECERALVIAAEQEAFGPAGFDEAGLLSRTTVSADGRKALFVVGNGVQVELAAAEPGHWLISGFARAGAS